MEKRVLVRQLELEGSLKTRSQELLIAKPDSARLIAPGRREAQDFPRNRGITHQSKLSNRREIFEADCSRCSIEGYRD